MANHSLTSGDGSGGHGPGPGHGGDAPVEAFGTWADAAPTVLWITDPEGSCVYLNRRWYDFTGQAAGAGLGWGWTDMVHPEDRPRVSEAFRRCAAERTACAVEYRVRHCLGGHRWVADTSEPRYDAAGRLVGYVGAVMDITDRKVAELGLRRSQQDAERRLAELEMLFETAPVGIALFDLEGRYSRVNRIVADLHRRTADQCVGLTPTEVRCVAAAPVERMLREVCSTGKTLMNAEVRLSGAGPDGSDVVWLTNVAPVRDGTGQMTGVWGVVQDVSELTRLREQLVQSQKMESIGRLAGGVAHDFNNLLTVIGGYAEQASERLPAGSAVGADIDQIRLAAGRAAEFTRQLLSFARRQVVEPRALDFREVLRSNEDLIRRLVGEDVDLRLALPPGPAMVMMDPGQCTQILLNLAANARDAMPEGGMLTIGVEVVAVGPAEVPPTESVRPGSYVKVTVADTGIGMPAHVRRRVFEPFFTTKSGGRGIGLASCYGIVKQAGGLIEVRSTEGGGTSFFIHLPVTGERPAVGITPAAKETPAAGHETVLVVEDEPMVREMISRVLRLKGYAVTEAGSPEQAAEAARAAGRAFDLVIADVVLPGGNGLDLTCSMVEARTASRAMLMSGYTGDNAAERLPFRLIAKPFELDGFLHAVRTVLEGPPGRSA